MTDSERGRKRRCGTPRAIVVGTFVGLVVALAGTVGAQGVVPGGLVLGSDAEHACSVLSGDGFAVSLDNLLLALLPCREVSYEAFGNWTGDRELATPGLSTVVPLYTAVIGDERVGVWLEFVDGRLASAEFSSTLPLWAVDADRRFTVAQEDALADEFGALPVVDELHRRESGTETTIYAWELEDAHVDLRVREFEGRRSFDLTFDHPVLADEAWARTWAWQERVDADEDE